MYERLKFNSSFPIIARSMSQSVVRSINFMLINTAQQIVRREQSGVPSFAAIDALADEINHIDNYDEAHKDDQDEAQSREIRVEQGFNVPEDPRIMMALLKIIREDLADNLLKNAGKVKLMSTGENAPNPYDLAQTVNDAITRQLTRANPISPSRVKLEALALGISEADILMAMEQRQQQQTGFMKANQDRIVEVINLVHWDLMNGNMDAETAFDRIPALTLLRLMVAADQGLIFARTREINNFLNQRIPDHLKQDIKGNVGLIDGERNALQDEANKYLIDAFFAREIDDAVANGASLPQFAARPTVILTDARSQSESARRLALAA